MKTIHGQFPRHSSRYIKHDIKVCFLYFVCFKMSLNEMLLFILMRVEIILFDNSVLKMYLLSTQLNFHIHLIIWFCLFAPKKTICRKYMIKRLIHDLFHIIPATIPLPISALDCVSGWHGGLGIIPELIRKRSCINLYIMQTARRKKGKKRNIIYV